MLSRKTILFVLLVLLTSSTVFSQQPLVWQAKWIERNVAEGNERPAQYFQRKFSTAGKLRSATLYITSRGLYEARLNGKRVGDAYLTPGWTSYNKRLQYQKYDVTTQLAAGGNVLDVVLGDGWYRGNIGFEGRRDYYGEKLALLCQLELNYANGKKQTVVSDENWQCGEGAIRYSEINGGETIDARMVTGNWSGVGVANYGYAGLIPTENEPVKKQQLLKPVRFFTDQKGNRVIDFGQNMTGWVVVKAKGKESDSIVLHHGEVLDKAGNFYNINYRGAKSIAKYIFSGNGEETFEPHFTYYGFRYVKVDGNIAGLTADNFSAVVLYSDMKPTGSFECSNPLLNKLQQNIVWGQRGNFLDVPTDCPQRDERLGWTGDAQAFFRTAAYNYNVKAFFSKWLKDLKADQLASGSVPAVVPDILGGFGGSAGWADASTIIPWGMYEVYGDPKVLAEQYESMKAWVRFMEQNTNEHGLWRKGFHFGDWLSYRPADDNGTEAVTDKFQIAQCFYGHSVQLLINAAEVLGKKDDVAQYEKLLARVKSAFMQEYLTPSGRLMSNTQTAYVLALQFDMLPENLRQQAADKLVENIRMYKEHLTTGFLGTPYLCHVLSRFGYADVAYTLLMQETYPSWLYPVKMGATTVWERWNGIKEDGEFYHPHMNSFNHYAYGAIGDWMYQNILGIQPAAPGYSKVIIKPLIGGKLTWAKGSFESVYGKIASSWKLINGKLTLDVEIPKGITATVYVPAAGGKTWEKKEIARAGTYHFEGK